MSKTYKQRYKDLRKTIETLYDELDKRATTKEEALKEYKEGMKEIANVIGFVITELAGKEDQFMNVAILQECRARLEE